MSELINNREARRETLKSIILDLHEGRDPVEVRKEFKDLLDQVGPEEIMALEQSLVDDGLDVEQITKLCDVHVAVFRESLEQIEEQPPIPDTHPLDVFLAENESVTVVLDKIKPAVQSIIEADSGTAIDALFDEVRSGHTRLMELDRHYTRKENILFPYLERHGVTGPSAVMWSIHDEIRQGLKQTSFMMLHSEAVATPKLVSAMKDTLLPLYDQISEMVYKEENILFPTCRDMFTEEEWASIASEANGEAATTYVKPEIEPVPAPPNIGTKETIHFDTGLLTPDEIRGILSSLPFDMTFVDKDDTVRFFSDGPDRVFERTRAIIGRKVQNCHPPSSVNVVDKILDDFKSGKRDHADFWIQSRGMFVYIRYFAVRSPEGEYLGTVEVTQNVQPIRELEGEQRIYDDAAAK